MASILTEANPPAEPGSLGHTYGPNILCALACVYPARGRKFIVANKKMFGLAKLRFQRVRPMLKRLPADWLNFANHIFQLCVSTSFFTWWALSAWCALRAIWRTFLAAKRIFQAGYRGNYL